MIGVRFLASLITAAGLLLGSPAAAPSGVHPCSGCGKDGVCIIVHLSVIELARTSRGPAVEGYVTACTVSPVSGAANRLVVHLQFFNYDSVEPDWFTEDQHTYEPSAYPPPGVQRRLQPRVETPCMPGQWRLVIYGFLPKPWSRVYPGPGLRSKGKAVSCR